MGPPPETAGRTHPHGNASRLGRGPRAGIAGSCPEIEVCLRAVHDHRAVPRQRHGADLPQGARAGPVASRGPRICGQLGRAQLLALLPAHALQRSDVRRRPSAYGEMPWVPASAGMALVVAGRVPLSSTPHGRECMRVPAFSLPRWHAAGCRGFPPPRERHWLSRDACPLSSPPRRRGSMQVPVCARWHAGEVPRVPAFAGMTLVVAERAPPFGVTPRAGGSMQVPAFGFPLIAAAAPGYPPACARRRADLPTRRCP
jgi:hypothetical protein